MKYPLWEEGFENLDQNMIASIIGFVEETFPSILNPDIDEKVPLDKNATINFHGFLVKEFKHTDDIICAANYVNTVFSIGNRARRLDACFFIDFFKQKYPDSFHHVEAAKRKQQYQAVEQAFLNDIEHGNLYDATCSKITLGRILVSLVLFSCILTNRRLSSIVSLLDNSDQSLLNTFWLDDLDEHDENFVIDRFIPDPMSRALIIATINHYPTLVPDFLSQIRGDPDTKSGKISATSKMLQSVKSYLKHLGFTEITSLKALYDISKQRWCEAMPGYMIGSMIGEYNCKPLPRRTFYRLIGAKKAVTLSLPKKHRYVSPSVDAETLARKELDTPYLGELRQAFTSINHPAPSAVKATLKKMVTVWSNLDDVPPITDLLARFAIDLLEAKTQRKARAVGTVYKNITTLGSRFERAFADVDPLQHFNEVDYLGVYESIINDELAGVNLKNIEKAMRAFNVFLSNRYDAPCPRESEIFFSSDDSPEGSPNFISEPEFKDMQARLNSCDDEHNVAELRAISDLAFYAGLRIGEIRHITRDQFKVIDDVVSLKLRPYDNVKLKSAAASRNLELYQLFPKASLDNLLDVLRAPVKHGQVTLFGQGASPQSDVNKMCALIVSTSHTVCGDPDLTFHHLRHSFVSRQIFRTWYRDLLRFFDDNPMMQSAVKPAWFDRDVSTQVFTPQINHSRNYLSDISHLTGHGTVDVTLDNYYHYMDIAQGITTRIFVPTLRRAMVENIIGCKKSRANDIISNAATPPEAWEAVITALQNKLGALDESEDKAKNGVEEDRALYDQAVKQLTSQHGNLHVAKMIADWEALRCIDRYLKSDMHVTDIVSETQLLSIPIPESRALKIAEQLPEMAAHVFHLTGKSKNQDILIPTLSDRTLKGVLAVVAAFDNAGFFNAKPPNLSFAVQMSRVFVTSWLKNTHAHVALTDKKDIKDMVKLYSAVEADFGPPVCQFQYNSASQISEKRQRAYWKKIPLVDAPYRQINAKGEAPHGQVIVSVDVSKLTDYAKVKLLGLRLVMGYLYLDSKAISRIII